MSRRLALIIGNSEYEDPTLARLKKSDADVRSLAEALHDSDCWQPAKVGHFETREIRDRERVW